MRYLALLVCCARAFAQAPPSEDNYIESTFLKRIGEVPKMGWFDPKLGFLTNQDVDEVSLFASVGAPSAAKKTKTIASREVRGKGIACESQDQDRLTVFQVSPVPQVDRALFTTKKIPGESRSGLVAVRINPEPMAAVDKVLGWPNKGALRRDKAIGARPDSFYYSIHKLYSSQTRLLRQEAIVLHGPDGKVIAFKLNRNLDTEPFCADCDNPTFEDDLSLYRPMNVFEVSGFPYPLVLLDTGTVEGRALSLLTFTPTGKLAEFRVYEYAVSCF